MTKRDLDDLKQYFKDIQPSLFEHYKFLYEMRTSIRKSFEFLLTFQSLILLAFLQLFGSLILQGVILFWIPLTAMIISIGMSFTNIFPVKIWFPWFEKEGIKEVWEKRDQNDFYEADIRSIFGVSPHLFYYDLKRKELFFKNVLWIYLSIVLAFTSILFWYKMFLHFFLFIPICIIGWHLIERKWNKEAVDKNPASEVEKFFDNWKKEVEEKKVERNKNQNRVKKK